MTKEREKLFNSLLSRFDELSHTEYLLLNDLGEEMHADLKKRTNRAYYIAIVSLILSALRLLQIYLNINR